MVSRRAEGGEGSPATPTQPVVDADVTGNIIGPDVPPDVAAVWRREIEERNTLVMQGSEAIIRLVEDRSRELLRREPDVRRMLEARQVPEVEIESVLEALHDPRNSFRWFETKIKGPDYYLLGHEGALAVDLIWRLAHAGTLAESNALIDEYILHEALERTRLSHPMIVDWTQEFFGYPEVWRPGQTRLGRILRQYIDLHANPLYIREFNAVTFIPEQQFVLVPPEDAEASDEADEDEGGLDDVDALDAALDVGVLEGAIWDVDREQQRERQRRRDEGEYRVDRLELRPQGGRYVRCTPLFGQF